MLNYAKKATWNLLHAYIYAHSQILIDEFPVDGVQNILIFQSQCVHMTFSDKNIYKRMFKQVVHKGGESEINYIRIFKNAKALKISVGKWEIVTVKIL